MLALLRKKPAAAAPPIACAYALNASALEIAALPPGGSGALVMSNADQTGSYSVVGSGTVADALAAPTGIGTGTSAKLDFSTGTKAIEWSFSVPAAVDQNLPLNNAYYAQGGVRTAAFGQICTVQVYADCDGTYTVSVDGAAGSALLLTGQVSAPSRVGVAFDAGAGTFAVWLDGVPQVLINNTYAPTATAIAFMKVNETANSAAGDAAKVVAMTLHTSAAAMTTAYPAGTTDVCGNLI